MEENGKPVEIRFRERGESELIEEFTPSDEAVAEYICASAQRPTLTVRTRIPSGRVFVLFVRPFGYRIDRGAARTRARRKRPPEAARAADASSRCARWRVPATRMSDRPLRSESSTWTSPCATPADSDPGGGTACRCCSAKKLPPQTKPCARKPQTSPQTAEVQAARPRTRHRQAVYRVLHAAVYR